MTPLQARVKAFVSDFIRDEGFSPSLQEIADGLGLNSRSGVRAVILRLRDEGHVTFLPGHPRSLQIVGQTERLISAAERVLDRIAVGEDRLGDRAAAAVEDLDRVLSELRPPETRSRRRAFARRGPDGAQGACGGSGLGETKA